MKVSLNTIKQYVDFELPPVDELVERINERLGGVEAVIDLGSKYKNAVIVKVVECEKHANADKLSVCKIDTGAGELVQVVCGAPNVHADMWTVWLPPESIVPSTYGTADEFKLGARELRGVMSNGMLAAGDELAINGDHDGIIEIDPNEWKPNDVEIKPGVSFAEAYGLSDYVIDIENKMFTHRPDLFGQIGVAREIAGIYGEQFAEKDWYWHKAEFASARNLELEVFNDAGEKVPRVMFVAMENVEIKPSPLWLQCALVTMGGKPINNIVDVTNYVMLLTAQPTHAYDYDKIRGGKIGARMAMVGEKIELLNGKAYELVEDDIVIADAEGAIGLGGIMGGGNSEVSPETRNIILEVATFDMYAVRRSSMRHGIFTDALTRFNKGQSPLQNDRIIKFLMTNIKDISPGQQASDTFDLRNETLSEAYDAQSLHGTMKVEASFINERLGLSLPESEIQQLLRNVQFACYVDEGDTAISITAPYWRTDIELPEDIVEEVGRLYGFDKLPRELPARSAKPTPQNARRELKQVIRKNLAKAGANEVLTYSFVHENIVKRSGQNPDHAFKLSNALSPDLEFYRMSLTSSLLDKVHMNSKAGYDSFAIFEIGKVHFKGEMDIDEPNVPNENDHVALIVAYADKQKPAGAPYYYVRNYLAQLANLDNLEIVPLAEFDMRNDEWAKQLTAAYAPNRSSVLVKDGQVWGVAGEFTSSVRRSFKLPEFTAGFELHLDLLQGQKKMYKPLAKFPSVTQDVSLIVAGDRPFGDVMQKAKSAIAGLDQAAYQTSLKVVDIYQAKESEQKTITLRLEVAHHEKTLTDKEVTAILDVVTVAVTS